MCTLFWPKSPASPLSSGAENPAALVGAQQQPCSIRPAWGTSSLGSLLCSPNSPSFLPSAWLRPPTKMAKKKKGGKKKRVAAHIRENQGKRAAAAASGDGELGADKRAPLLAPPLGVGKPKRPREPGQSRNPGALLPSAAVCGLGARNVGQRRWLECPSLALLPSAVLFSTDACATHTPLAPVVELVQ